MNSNCSFGWILLFLAGTWGACRSEEPAKPKSEPVPLPETVAQDAKLKLEYEEKRFFESPVWDPKGEKLYFSSFGSKKSAYFMRLDETGKASIWWEKTDGAGGAKVTADGRFLTTQAYAHRVTAYDFSPEGPLNPKILHTDETLFQPNDLCLLANGDLYFTDPDFKGKTGSSVWHLSAGGKATKVSTEMVLPNGIAASLDGKTLYVADSNRKHWKSFPIQADGLLGAGKIFFAPESESKNDPDGMTIDARGNLYATGLGGVWVIAPDGKCLGLIPVPEFCSNAAFGGKDFTTLYLTCAQKVYSLEMNVAGGRAK